MNRIRSVVSHPKGSTEALNRRLNDASSEYGALVTRFAFAFVFLSFGLQKLVVPGPSPVDDPIIAVATAFRFPMIAPVSWAPVLVGVYEVLLGVCFLLNRLGVAILLFIPHQMVAFLTLAIVPSLAFRPPIPFAYDTFGAFVLKNVVFVGAFLLLLAQRSESGGSSKETIGA